MAMTRRAFTAATVAVAVAVAAGLHTRTAIAQIQAQVYPSRSIRLVIPYAPGGPTDVLGRLMAEQLGQRLGQPVVVENRAGAGGIVGMIAVNSALPDGYTLLLGDINLSVGPALHKSLPYDPVRGFTPIGMIATAPMLMLVPPDSRVDSARAYVDGAKAAPGALSYASAGIGSPPHLAAELLKSRYGLDVVHVPYSGSGPALTSTAAGQTSLIFTGMSGARPLVDAGKLRPLAITGQARSPVMPQVPTLKEAGLDLPELSAGSWWGLLGPAGMPAAIVDKLNDELGKVLGTPAVAKRLADLNYAPAAGSADDFRAWVAGQTTTWTAVLRQAGIRPD